MLAGGNLPLSGLLEPVVSPDSLHSPVNSALCAKTPIEIACHPCYHVVMIQAFNNKGTEDIFNGKNTKEARKICPRSLLKTASRKLDQIDSASKLDDLKIPPGNMLELLQGNRKGEHSIRINNQYRICFVWSESGPNQVEITDYH